MSDEKKYEIHEEDSWTDGLEEAIQRQTMKEQQEYGTEDIFSPDEIRKDAGRHDEGQDRSRMPGENAASPENRASDVREAFDGGQMEHPAFSDENPLPNDPAEEERRDGGSYNRRSRNFADPEEAGTMNKNWEEPGGPDDAVLFDEVDSGSGPSAKGKGLLGGSKKKSKKKSGKKRNSKTEGKDRSKATRRTRNDRYDDWEPEDDDRYDDEEEREERNSRSRHRTSSPYEEGMSRKERREYEEFLAYKEQQQRHGRKKKKHRIRNAIITILVLLFLVLPILAIAARMIGITQGVSTQDIKDLLSDEVKKSQETGAMAGYTNIALFGLDSTQQSLDAGNNRTDVMIIASINNKTGEVKLVSLYRDTYLDIGDGNYQKANAAYAFGGPEQAIKMINTNLDLNITDYVTVGFGGVADLVDEVGGVEIDVQSDEIEHLNNYQSTMAVELGKEYVPVTTTGVQTLNGLQATAYCRIRYTDGGDFKRTERQKEVLSKAFEKLKKSGPVTMIKAANSLSSEIRTSLNPAEIASLAMKAFRFNISETSGFPNDQYRTVGYIGDQSCVIPIHLTDNVVWLHQYLFGDTSYQVSQTVQTISDEVSARSGY